MAAVTPGVLTTTPGSDACCAFSCCVSACSHGREWSGYCGGDCAKAGEAAIARARLATLPRTRFLFNIFVSFGLGAARHSRQHPKKERAANFAVPVAPVFVSG